MEEMSPARRPPAGGAVGDGSVHLPLVAVDGPGKLPPAKPLWKAGGRESWQQRLLEPILSRQVDRWVTPCGAPPRGLSKATLASASTHLASEPSEEDTGATLRSSSYNSKRADVVVSRRLPPMSARRKRARARRLAVGMHKLPSITVPPSAETVTEALYVRDMVGKEGCLWRQKLDAEVSERDEELAGLAMYRKDITEAARQQNRAQAARWREAQDREDRIDQLRWRLEEEGEFAKLVPQNSAPPREGLPPRAPTPTSPSLLAQARRKLQSVVGSRAEQEKRKVEEMEELLIASEDKIPGSPRGQPRRSSMDKGLPVGREGRRRSSESSTPIIQPALAVVVGAAHSEHLKGLRGRLLANRKPERVADKKTQRVLDRYDKFGNGMVEVADLKDVLVELGFGGENGMERRQVHKECRSLRAFEITHAEVAHTVVPNVRARLEAARLEQLREQFREADINKNGMLSMGETVQMLRQTGTYPNVSQVLAVLQDLLPDVFTKAQSLDGQWLMSRDVLDFDLFCSVMKMLKQRTADEIQKKLKELNERYDLDGQWQARWGSRLLDMHETFQQYCKEGRPGVVDMTKFASFLHDVGYSPAHHGVAIHVPRCATSMANEEGELSFQAILKATDKVLALDRVRLLRLLEKFEHNGNHTFSLLDCRRLLQEAGCMTHNKAEEDCVRACIQQFDTEDTDEVCKEHAVDLVHDVTQQLRKYRKEAERHTADNYGYSTEQLKEFRSVFKHLDADLSGHLDKDELGEAVRMLRRSACAPDVDELVACLGVGRGTPDRFPNVDFLTFLNVMYAMDQKKEVAHLSEKLHVDLQTMNQWKQLFDDLSPGVRLVGCDEVKEFVASHSRAFSEAAADQLRAALAEFEELVDFEGFAKLLSVGDAKFESPNVR